MSLYKCKTTLNLFFGEDWCVINHEMKKSITAGSVFDIATVAGLFLDPSSQ
jgi:hypothetical protein